jgi:hypothetical protein
VIAELMPRLAALPAVLALVALGTGCAGARTNVVADSAQYPISMSRAVRDADGSIVPQERVAKVGKLHSESMAWGLLYSGIRLTPRTDISKAVNRQVAAAGGDAIVNLRIMGSHCGGDFIPVVSLVPIWPGCANIVVEGDIIRVIRANVEARRAISGARIVAMEEQR